MCWKNGIIIGVLLLLPSIIFRAYFFEGKVLFPANLLVSFYTPWKQEKEFGIKIPNKPIGFDNVRTAYPNIQFTIEELKKGNIPLWNPYISAGNMHLATYLPAVFYPLHLIYFLVPLIDAWSVLVIVQPLITSICMYLLLSKYRYSWQSSLFGAIAWGYTGWMMVWWEESLVVSHSVIWLPLIMLGIISLQEKKSWGNWLLIVMGYSLSILAGFFQTTLYIGILTCAYGVFHAMQKKDKQIVWLLIAAGGTSLAMTSVQWIPTVKAFLQSPRSISDARYLFEQYLLPLPHLITTMLPDYFGNPGTYNYFGGAGFFHEKNIFIGIVPILFAIVAVVHKKTRETWFWIVTVVVTLLLGTYPTGWIIYNLHIPILSSSLPSRIFVISAFAIVMLATNGIEAWKKKNIKVRHSIYMIGIVMISAVIVSLVKWACSAYVAQLTGIVEGQTDWLKQLVGAMAGNEKQMIEYKISLRNCVIPLGLLILVYAGTYIKEKKWAMILLIIVTASQSIYFANKYVYVSQRTYVFPKTELIEKLQSIAGIDRVWGYGNAWIDKNFLSYYHIQSAEGYQTFFPIDYGMLLNTVRYDGKLSLNINRSDIDLERTGERVSLLDNPINMRLLALTGTKYIIESTVGEGKEALTTEERFPLEAFRLAWENELWRIWEYKSSIPRLLFVSTYIVASDKQQQVTAVLDPAVNLLSTVILEKTPLWDEASEIEGPTESIVQLTKYDASKITIQVNAKENGILVLSDAWYSGWTAYVDGKKQEILKANYAFRGVAISKGNHTVVFTYEPLAFRIASYISLGTVSILIITSGMLLVLKRYKKRK